MEVSSEIVVWELVSSCFVEEMCVVLVFCGLLKVVGQHPDRSLLQNYNCLICMYMHTT